MSGDPSSRSPWFVPILVAVVTALGGIAVAIISNQPQPAATSTPPLVAPGTPSTSAPSIAGRYFLDPGNPRIIVITGDGADAFTIEEQEPASWPFRGRIEWVAGGHFDGIAQFKSGTRMRVIVTPMPNGELVTTFDYLTDDQGVTITRIDKHVLIPAG